MRVLIAGLAILAAACSADVNVGDGDGDGHGGGYTLEVRATQAEQTYLITAPDGRVVGARAAEGASAFMDGERAQRLAADPPPQGEAPPEVMSLRLPGVNMQVNAEDNGTDGENGRVNFSLGANGQNVVVNADEGGPGEADDRAYVRITGADESAVRDFINDAEELSADVKTQVLAALGIAAAAPEENKP